MDGRLDGWKKERLDVEYGRKSVCMVTSDI